MYQDGDQDSGREVDEEEVLNHGSGLVGMIFVPSELRQEDDKVLEKEFGQNDNDGYSDSDGQLEVVLVDMIVTICVNSRPLS